MDLRDQRPDAWRSLRGSAVSEPLFVAASPAGISVARQAGESWNVEAVASAPARCLATDEGHLLAGTSDRARRSDGGDRTCTASGLRGLRVTGIDRRQGLVPGAVWRQLLADANFKLLPVSTASPTSAL